MLWKFVSALVLGVVAATTAADKKNVLFIPVDDLRTELGCYGNTFIKSPNIDRLAKRGIVLERAYCQQAVCSPSRTSLLTGRRPDTTKVYDLVTHFRKNIPNVVTLPQHFKNNGYVVYGTGKIFHGSLNDDPSWTVFEKEGGTAYASKQVMSRIAKLRAEGKKKGLKGKALRKHAKGPAYECAAVPDNTYADGRAAEKAIAALRKYKDKPFFIACGFHKPHLPFVAPKKYWDMYKESEIELADNPFLPKNAPTYSGTTWGELRAYSGIPQKGPLSDEVARTLRHGYYACISYTDAQVGRLLDELDRLGLADKTIIVLWGDHGWKLGEHGLWCKHTNFELDDHAPMIFAAPGLGGAGQKTKSLVEFVDIFPTLCDLAGLSKPSGLEGTSMVALLNNPSLTWKPAAFSQYPRGKVMGYAMKTDRYRYIEWQDRKTKKPVARELYDHKKDPKENVNVAGSPENAELVKKLSKQLNAGWKAAVPVGK